MCCSWAQVSQTTPRLDGAEHVNTEKYTFSYISGSHKEFSSSATELLRAGRHYERPFFPSHRHGMEWKCGGVPPKGGFLVCLGFVI